MNFVNKTPNLHADLFDRAFRFHLQVAGDAKVVRWFASGIFLSGRNPLSVILKAEWRLYVSIEHSAFHANGRPMHNSRARVEWKAFLGHIQMVHLQYASKKGMEMIPFGLDVNPMYYLRHGYREYAQNLVAWASPKTFWDKHNALRPYPTSCTAKELFFTVLLPTEFQ